MRDNGHKLKWHGLTGYKGGGGNSSARITEYWDGLPREPVLGGFQHLTDESLEQPALNSFVTLL